MVRGGREKRRVRCSEDSESVRWSEWQRVTEAVTLYGEESDRETVRRVPSGMWPGETNPNNDVHDSPLFLRRGSPISR